MKKLKFDVHLWEKTQKKPEEFSRIFLRISAGLLAIVIAGMSILYGGMRQLIIAQNKQMSLQAFTQIQREFENINETANEIATQVSLDDVCSRLLKMLSGERLDSLELNRIRNQLTMYQTANSAVESIYIYSAASDLILSSGSLLVASELEEFRDEGIQRLLEHTEELETNSLILRQTTGIPHIEREEDQKVYTKILSAGRGSMVVVNLNYDEIVRGILSMDILNESRMLIVSGGEEPLVDVQTAPIDLTKELLEVIGDMEQSGTGSREITLDGGERYFISCLHSGAGGWNYVKITRWNEVFGILRSLAERTIAIVAVTVCLMLLVIARSAVATLRLQRLLQKKAGYGMSQEDLNQLKEGFLNDFLHGNRLFTKSQIREKMENFHFIVSEGKKYFVLILKLEKQERFRELYGEKGTYDIEFAYRNIFEETYARTFKITGVINGDYTITFLLEADTEMGDEMVQEQLQDCFEQFCVNQKKFICWDFFCAGIGHGVKIEEIPEANEELKKELREGFFYPSNTYHTIEQMKSEHSGQVDFQKVNADRLIQGLRSGEQVEKVYKEVLQVLKKCSYAEYMNLVIWLGITVMRGVTPIRLREEEINGFLVALSRCEKQNEVDECFRRLFENIHQNQERSAVKKGVVGRLDEVKRYIEENYQDSNITLERLADEFGGSSNYIGRLFRQDTGMSVAEYINEIRLQEVMRRLRETKLPAKEIAEQCGFISNNYFYTYFRKKTGLTPQTYRERYRELKNAEQEEE